LAGMMDVYKSKHILEEEDVVLNSSTDLFYYYRQTLEVFSEYSRSKPFVALSEVFAKWLRHYADLLISKLPKYFSIF
jgi:hypothetical protein